MASLAVVNGRPSLSREFAERYGIEPEKIYALLRDTVLKSKDPVTDAEVAAFMVVANKHELNPFLKEIYGFMSKGKMQYVVGVDGWITLCNRHPMFNGIDFEDQFKGDSIFAISCKIHRRDRTLPIVVTEYYSECYKPPVEGKPGPWQSHPIRMLRHKALIQCARIAFGFAGVMDEDEAERMEGYSAPTGTTLEASTPREQDEADRLMAVLKWNAALQRTSRQQYDGRLGDLVTYLKGEVAKAERGSKKVAKTIQAEPVQEAQSTPQVAEQQQEQQQSASEDVAVDNSWMEAV